MCAQNTRPDGVALGFQVCRNKVEPSVLNSRFNLLPKNSLRPMDRDEPFPYRPEVSLVLGSFPPSCGAEGLAGAGACPDGAVPACELEGVGPPADPGEEVALSVAPEVVRWHVCDASSIYVSLGDQPVLHELAEPLAAEGVDLVVVNFHLNQYRIDG
jgi:hypothetical protein